LGTVGYLASLRRTAFGSFEVSAAIPLEKVMPGAELPILSPRVALAGLRELEVDEQLAARIRKGQQAAAGRLSATPTPAELAKVVNSGGKLVALVGEDEGRWRIQRVFAETPNSQDQN